MQVRDILIATFCAFAWGFSFVVIKIGLNSFPPLMFSAIRFLLAALPLVFFLKKPDVSWRIILGMGFVLGVVKFTLLFVGLSIGASAGLASIVMQSQAFFTVVLVALVFGTRPSKQQIAGLFVAFSGLTLIGFTIETGAGSLGLAFVTLAGLAWAISNLIMRRAGEVKMLNLMVWVCLVPPIPLAILSVVFEGTDASISAIHGLNWSGFAAVVYVAYIATILAYAGWGSLIQRFGPNQVAPFSLLVPVFGMSTSAIVLGESFGPLQVVASLVVLVGIALVIWKRNGQNALVRTS
ncbi:O-acetylserine/cysteine efflux transporter [Labrenzia sp. EL_208]|nr:O-acetylserine/cysteine efflux transporter [Labrenzia sp. EL_132]MBG6230831.1 O-acetylserine/cysteine efflux transporter [Labrenzia sp. EL_208]